MLCVLLAGGAARAQARLDAERDHLEVAGVPISVALIVESHGRDPHAVGDIRTDRIPLRFHSGDGGQETSEVEVAGLTVGTALESNAGSATPTLVVFAHALAPTWISLIAIELTLPPSAVKFYGSDLRPVDLAVGTRAILDRFDPKWIVLQGVDRATTLVADDTLDGLSISRDANAIKIRAELEQVAARPFLHDASCKQSWHSPNSHLPIRARMLIAEEARFARIQIVSGAPAPLFKTHFPDGRRAAFVLTDHADQSSARTLRALAYGRSDFQPGMPGMIEGGFLGHHLVITKALFDHTSALPVNLGGGKHPRGKHDKERPPRRRNSHGGDEPQLESPVVRALADELLNAGWEIVPHSATPLPDNRVVTESALEHFEHFSARTWIDHQPETNCEAFGDQGFRSGGRWGIADLLEGHNYEYIWAEVDAPADHLNLLQPRALTERRPTLWPLGRLDDGGPPDLWMFRTSWSFLSAKEFFALYSRAALDRLERERGLHIGHTYLESYHPPGTHFAPRNLLTPIGEGSRLGGRGEVALDRRFEALLTDLESRQTRSSLWVTTLVELGDFLRRIAAVQTTVIAPGKIRVHADRPLTRASFMVPIADARILVAGKLPTNLRRDATETIFWLDLPAGDTEITVSSAADAQYEPTKGPTSLPPPSDADTRDMSTPDL